MYCKYCGKNIPDDSIFCNYCGKNIDDKEEESVIAKCSSVYDDKALLALNKVGLKKAFVPLIIFCLSFVLFGVASIFLEDYFLGISFVIIGFLFYPIMLLCNKGSVKIQRKNSSLLNTVMRVDFNFKSDKFIAITKYFNEEEDIENRAYNLLKSVYEDNDYFYLFISNIQAHIVAKSGMQKGTIDDIRNLILRNIPIQSYKSYMKKS